MEQLSAEAIRQFQLGISLTLSNWVALIAGIENGFGSPRTIPELTLRIFNFFHQPNRRVPMYLEDMEDALYELLSDGLESVRITADDGSTEEVIEDLIHMYDQCLDGNYESIQKLKQVRRAPVPQVESDDDVDENAENMENDDASDMMVDSSPIPTPGQTQKNEISPQQMGENEDGWVIVSSKKNKGRKH